MLGNATGYNSPLWLHVFASSWRNWTRTKNMGYLIFWHRHIQVGSVTIACIDRTPLNDVVKALSQSEEMPLSLGLCQYV